MLTLAYCQSTFSIIFPMVSITLYFQVFKDLTQLALPCNRSEHQTFRSREGAVEASLVKSPSPILPTFLQTLHLPLLLLHREKGLCYGIY